MRRRSSNNSGFTLIEMLVSLALFSVVVLVAIGALLSLVGANKKAQALEDVMNNLNITIDDMVRNAREGTNFDGQLTINGSPTCNTNSGGPNDCTGGGTAFEFEPYGGNVHTNDQWVFAYDSKGTICGQADSICKSTDGGQTWTAVTSPDVSITSMTFYVVGTMRGDTLQPKVVIVIQGTAGTTDIHAATTFHVEATAVQRVLDL
jgi:prepilin-type N-terminal cleavage/methylation domain-containing protein